VTVHRVLIVDDQEDLLRGVAHLVEELGHETELATTAEEGLKLALETSPDLVITDLNLPNMSGMDLLKKIRESGLEPTTLVLTGYGTIDSAVEATKHGVYDYLTKPVRSKELKAVVRKALEREELQREVGLLRREMIRSGKFQELVGSSPQMLEIYRLIEQVAPAEAPVLITGESGTGKEVVARTIHALSERQERRLVAVNCAAVPSELLESEMFGHEKGAFTGAVNMRRGCFELADKSTLFLDEIGDMPMRLQSKLLRVLENGTFQRVGGEREITVDVRIIAATNTKIESLLDSKEFRQDLYFRLNVFHVNMPPLRERREDIALLVERFSQQVEGAEKLRPAVFSSEAVELLKSYDWPGNAREVRNVVHRARILCNGSEVQREHLPPQIRPRVRSAENGRELTIPVGTSIAEVERELILRTLEAEKGNKTKTASILGISTKTLYSKLARYEGLEAKGG